MSDEKPLLDVRWLAPLIVAFVLLLIGLTLMGAAWIYQVFLLGGLGLLLVSIVILAWDQRHE